jgi:uncharacterized protein
MPRTLLAVALSLLCAGGAQAAMVTRDVSFTASDGVRLHAVLGAEGTIAPRPTIVEFSPYAPGCCASIAGPAYNYVQVHARGTGESDGRWTATGPRDQADVAEFLGWACHQPWSDGNLALYGFSASAIVAYNAMDLELPCLRTAVLMAGTADLYRDLLYIGGIPNFGPGAVVLTEISALSIGAGPQRMQRAPASAADVAAGQLQIGLDYFAHPTEDAWWRDRTLDPSRLKVPILADTSFYDVESRGPFEAYKLTRGLGSHLLVMGAHDGVPAGSGGQFPRYKRWFDHYLLGEDNGVEREPPVELWLGDGSRQEFLAGHVTRLDGTDWPLPGTRWTPLYLDGEALSTTPAASETTRSYPFAPSDPVASDPNTTAVVAGTGGGGYSFEDAFSLVPGSTEMNQADATSLTFTTPPLAGAIDVAGPASLHVRLASTAPETDVHAVVTDVWPDGSAHPVGLGRLRTSYPNTIAARNVVDPASGELVQPYADFSAKTPAAPGTARDYDVEFWPIGNHFAAGHRIRLYLTGTAAYAIPPAPAVNTVTTGGPARARLVLPTVGAAPTFERRP